MEAQELEKKFSTSERAAYRVASHHLGHIGLHPWCVHIKKPGYEMSIENITDKTSSLDIETWYKNAGLKSEDLPPRDHNKLNKLMAKFSEPSTNPLHFNIEDLCVECAALGNDFNNKISAVKNAPQFIERVFTFLKENHGVDEEPLSTDNYIMAKLPIEDGNRKYACIIGYRPKEVGGQIFQVWVYVPLSNDADNIIYHLNQKPCLRLETFKQGVINALPELEVNYAVQKIGPHSLTPLVKVTTLVQSAIAFAGLARKNDVQDEDEEETDAIIEQSNPAKMQRVYAIMARRLTPIGNHPNSVEKGFDGCFMSLESIEKQAGGFDPEKWFEGETFENEPVFFTDLLVSEQSEVKMALANLISPPDSESELIKKCTVFYRLMLKFSKKILDIKRKRESAK